MVLPRCDSYQASAVLLAGILAFPAPLARKWIGAAVGVAFLMLLNLGRLVVLLWVSLEHPTLFQTMHFEVLPGVFLLVALGLWLGWMSWVRRAPSASP